MRTMCSATVLAGILILGCGLAWAGGQALSLKHPVLDWKVSPATPEQCAAATKAVMALSEQQLLSHVPPFGYSQYCECPNCYGGVEGNDVLQWAPEKPEELKCRYCGTVVYPNPKYPETRVLTGTNPLGETVSFRYYFDEARQAPHFFSTHLLLHKRRWLTGQLNVLARAFANTGNPAYARPVALCLDRFAQVYPHYPVMQNLPRRYVFRESQKPPYAWDSGRWNYFHNEVPLELIPAYDLVYASGEFDKLSAERGYDVRERIERDFLKAATEAAMAYPDYVSNIIGYSPRSAALLGQVIGEPRYVHWAFDWMARNVNSGFFRDGLWSESPSYHYMTIGGLQSCFDAVAGYSDPPGYKDPADGRRFDKLDPTQALPLWGRCLHAPEIIGLPNGCSTCVHDTHPYERRGTPREATVSTIAPGYGHASLGHGRAGNQLQAQLHFSGAYGHSHSDNLNLTLYAREREMLSDLGYTWTQMRYWCTCTLGHNTVVVDRADQDRRQAEGNLLAFYPGGAADGLQVEAVEAEAPGAYRTVKDLDCYRRLLVTIPVTADEVYVVDVFRVRGGRSHDWTLGGDADEDTTATCSLPLTGKQQWLLEEGEKWVEPQLEGHQSPPYGFVRDVARADFAGQATVDYAYGADGARGLKVHLLGDSAELLLGRCPSVRRMGVGSRGDMRKAYDFWMPKLLLRRRGDGPLQSLFAAVHEPWAGKPFLTKVRRLAVSPAEPACVALQVTHAAGTDTIISTLDEAPYTERVTETGVKLQGRVGIVREQGGKISGVWVFDGTSLAGANWAVRGQPAPEPAEVTGAWRTLDGAPLNALLTAAPLPEGEVLKGRWLILTLPNGNTQGYEIDHVERREGQTVVALTDDPALKIEGDRVSEVYFPGRSFTGRCRLRVPGLLSLLREPGGAYRTDLTAGAEVSLPQ